MSISSPQMNTLRDALQRYDGEPGLAKALGVTTEALSSWLCGHDNLPPEIYLKARRLVVGARR